MTGKEDSFNLFVQFLISILLTWKVPGGSQISQLQPHERSLILISNLICCHNWILNIRHNNCHTVIHSILHVFCHIYPLFLFLKKWRVKKIYQLLKNPLNYVCSETTRSLDVINLINSNFVQFTMLSKRLLWQIGVDKRKFRTVCLAFGLVFYYPVGF